MAFQLSPGVQVREQDLTNVVPAVATTIGGIVGDFIWGPAHQIMSVDSENNLAAIFGQPSASKFLYFMTASSFLAYGSNLLVSREVGSAARNAVSSGTAVLIRNEDEYTASYSAGEGSVGPDFSSMFTMFINNKLDKIISPADILTKDEQYVMNTLTHAVGKDDEFRADISSVIATRVINYSIALADKGAIGKPIIDRIAKLTTDCDAFTDDLRYYMVKEIVNGNKVKFSQLMMNQNVVKMAVK